MIKIYFAEPVNWGISAEQLLSYYKRQTPNNSGVWNDNLIGTTNRNEADYFIVQDDTYEPVDKQRVIFFGREPNYVIPTSFSHKWADSFRYYHHEIGNAWLPATWWVNISYDEIDCEPYEKTKKFSMIDSGKKWLDGHKNRHLVIDKFLAKYSNEVDVWGKITEKKENIPPYKTALPPRAKENGLIPYRYSLGIENGLLNLLWGEKIMDPLLCWCMPIYYGCKNISKFFPDGSYIYVDIHSPTIEDEIMHIINTDIREKNLDKIKEARLLIRDKWNIWPMIEKAIISYKLL